MTAPNTPEALLREMQEVLRQIRTSGHAEVSASAGAVLSGASLVVDGAWHDDPAVYVDVFVRNGGLRVDCGADVSAGAAWLSYSWRIYQTSDDGMGGVFEGLYREADPLGAVEVNGGSLGASRARRINGLPTGNYRVRGAYRALAGATNAQVWNRSLVVIPR